MQKRRWLWLVVFTALALFVYKEKDAVMSIASVGAYAVLVTLILSPFCVRLEKSGFSKTCCALACILCLIFVLILILLAFIPYLADRALLLAQRLMPAATEAAHEIELFAQKGFRMDDVFTMGATMLSDFAGSAAKCGLAILSQTGLFLFSLVVAFYLLQERECVCNHLVLLIPTQWRKPVLYALQGCKDEALGYLSSVFKTALFTGGMTFLGLLALGVEDSFLLGVFMGLFEVIPYLGPFLGIGAIVLSALPLGINKAIEALVVVIVVQQVESSVAGPFFAASSTTIRPLTALVSVFVFGCLWGIWGMILAVPAVLIARSLLWSYRRFEIA